jgi:hypothetical protein
MSQASPYRHDMGPMIRNNARCSYGYGCGRRNGQVRARGSGRGRSRSPLHSCWPDRGAAAYRRMWTVGVAQAMPDDAQIDPRETIEALRRELDARTAERDEALAERAAIAEVLQVIASSPGDLASVFDEILEKAHSLCGASRGTLFLFDGEVFRAAASQGYPGGPPERVRRGIAVTEDPRLAALLGGERLIHIPDLSRLDDPIARAVAQHGGVRTNLLLPLRKDGTPRRAVVQSAGGAAVFG